MIEIKLNKCNCYFCVYHNYKDDYDSECYCELKEGKEYHKINCYGNNTYDKDLIKPCPYKEYIK